RSAFRLGLLALLAFHTSVLLTMNISFASNTVLYGAFFVWQSANSPTQVYDTTSRATNRGIINFILAGGLLLGVCCGILIINDIKLGRLLLSTIAGRSSSSSCL